MHCVFRICAAARDQPHRDAEHETGVRAIELVERGLAAIAQESCDRYFVRLNWMSSSHFSDPFAYHVQRSDQ